MIKKWKVVEWDNIKGIVLGEWIFDTKEEAEKFIKERMEEINIANWNGDLDCRILEIEEIKEGGA